jgi:putative ABC transport system permease protein
LPTISAPHGRIFDVSEAQKPIGIMLKNYLKVAWRSLLRNRTFSVINITGLAIGLGCFLSIALYVLDELSFDRYYDKAGNIYRINMDAR